MKFVKRVFDHFLYKNQTYSILKNFIRLYWVHRKQFGSIHSTSRFDPICRVETPSTVFIEENTRIRSGIQIVNSPEEKVIIKKYSAIGPNCTIISGNHKSTVGVPHVLLGLSHINDRHTDIIIHEDVWIGTGVTILPGAEIGRGCIVAAGTIVSKPVPPYSVVVGSPAKVIGKKFELEDILKHEEVLYRPEERMTREELEAIFAEHFVEKKTFGTNKPLTEEEKQRIQGVKEWIGYVEPY